MCIGGTRHDAGIELAGVFNDVGFKANHAADQACTAGFDGAGVVNDGTLQRTSRPGAHKNVAVFGRYQLAVFNEGVEAALVDDDGEPTGGIGEGNLFTGGQDDGAELGADDAFVTHFGCEQCDEAGLFGRELTLVGDDTLPLGEIVFTGEEIDVGDFHGTGNETADIDFGTRPEEHAVAVNDKDLAVGSQFAVDLGGVRRVDAV